MLCGARRYNLLKSSALILLKKGYFLFLTLDKSFVFSYISGQ